jgi:prepilin-type processing-associated H-X9-DG protein
MQCSNHHKQYGIALHNYHDSTGALQAAAGLLVHRNAAGTLVTGYYEWSPITFLLPFLEQQARYDAILGYVPSSTFVRAYDDIAPHRETIPTISCPSDSDSRVDKNTRTKTSIVHSLADAINSNRDMIDSDAISGRSAFVNRGWKTLAAITDGTSNTIAASETKVTKNRDNREAGRSAMNGVGATLETNPRQCLDHLDPSNKKFYKSTYTYGDTGAANTYIGHRGFYAFLSFPNNTAFCTVLPPNTANCSNGDHNGWGIYSAFSNHSGGVNVALFDGSVRFISDTINNVSTGITTPKQVTSGPSEFGVWGALGTISGGESAAP